MKWLRKAWRWLFPADTQLHATAPWIAPESGDYMFTAHGVAEYLTIYVAGQQLALTVSDSGPMALTCTAITASIRKGTVATARADFSEPYLNVQRLA